MKSFTVKHKFLLIIMMSILFLLILTNKSNAATDKYLFFGDSRTKGMIGNTDSIGNFAGKVLNTDAITKMGGAWYINYFHPDSKYSILKYTLDSLDTAPDGTIVIIWLGVNDLANTQYGTPTQQAELYVNQIKYLADHHKNLMFCQVSVTDVYERNKTLSNYRLITNPRIDEFNRALSNKITNIKNYTYIDINSQFRNYIVNKNISSDGVHYYPQYSKYISDRIYEQVSKINYSNDTTSPTISNIKVTSPAKGTYKEGIKITIKATYSENIYGNKSSAKITKSTAPKLTIKFGSGKTRTATFDSVSGKTITYTYKIQKDDNGKLQFSGHTGTVYDAAGNSLSVSGKIKSIGGNVVTADTTKPTLKVTGNPTSWTKKDVTLTIKAEDKGAGLKNVTVSGKAITLKNGQATYKVTKNGKYEMVATDKVGNSTKQTVNVSKIDRTSPKLNSMNVTSPAGGVYKAGTKITIVSTYSENAYGTASKGKVDSKNAPKLTIKFGSGKAKTATFDSVNGKTITYTYKIQKGDNGKLAFDNYTGTVYDAVGNSLAVKGKVSKLGGNAIEADTENPTLKVTGNPSDWVKTATLTIKATDNKTEIKSITVNGSGIKLTNGQGTYKVSKNGTYEIIATDKVGNSGKQTVKVTKIDNVKPTVTVTGNPSNWTKNDVTLTIKPEDKESGVKNVTVNGTEVKLDSKGQATCKVTKNGSYEIIVKDKVGNTSDKKTIKVAKIDKTKPTLTVSGNPSNWVKNATLTIKAEDKESGVDSVTVNGTAVTLDSKGQATYKVTKNGTYEIVATDKVGNTSDKKTIKVTKIDKTKPTLTVSGNPNSWTKNNVMLKIKVEDKESQIKSVTVNGQAITLDSKGEGTYKVTKNGTYEIVATDKVGNSSSKQTIKVTKIDKTKPTVTVNGNPTSWAKEAILSIKAEDKESGVKNVTVNGQTVTLDSKGEGTYKVTQNGTYEIISLDKVGNASDKKTIKVTKIDTTKPTLTVSGNPSDWTNKDVTLTIKPEDKESGIKSVTVNRTVVTLDSKGQATYKVTQNGTYEIVAIDKLGNSSAKKSVKVTKIDKTKPTVTVSGNSSSWTNKDVILTIKPEDKESGVNSVTVNGTAVTLDSKGQATCKATKNGTYEIVVKDKLNNSVKKTVKVTKIDKTKPTVDVTGNPSNWVKEALLTIKVDDKESGVANVTVNGNAVTPTNGQYTYKVAKNGTYEILVKDYAGNSSSKQTISVTKIDSTKPTITVTGNPNSWTNGDVKLKIKVEDKESDIENLTVNGTKITLKNGEGTCRVTKNATCEIIAKDKVGNSSKQTVKVTKIDKTKPKLTITGTPNNWAKKATLTIKAEDNESDIKNVTVNGEKITLTKGQALYEVTQNGTYEIVANDNAGNASDRQTIKINQIDKTAPKITSVVKTPETKTNEKVTLKVTAQDSESGIKEYSFDNGKTWQTSKEKTYYQNTNGIKIKVKDNAENIKTYDETINITNIEKQLNMGDINKDNKVNISDVIAVIRHIGAKEGNKYYLDEEKRFIADINQDGKINIADVIGIIRLISSN